MLDHEYPISSPYYEFLAFLAHLSRRLIGELIVYEGIHRPSVVRPLSINCLSTFSNDTSSEAKKPIIFTYSIYRSRERIIVFFLFRSYKNVVATATYSSHRLIMGKEEIDHFFFPIVNICIFFTEMFIQ